MLYIVHGRFYPSKKTPDYKMIHQLFTLFWIISNILTFHFHTISVIYTFYFYIAFEELTFYQKWSIKCVLYSLFYWERKHEILTPPSAHPALSVTRLGKSYFWVNFKYQRKDIFRFRYQISPFMIHELSTNSFKMNQNLNWKKVYLWQ